MINTKNLNFKKNKLYYGTKNTGFRAFPQMWSIKYPDGSLSKDVYNLTRAKEHCVKEYIRQENNSIEALPELTDAFK